ncbi:MAG: DUF401 family protein [Candidatus Bathyarchaeia archaeon]
MGFVDPLTALIVSFCFLGVMIYKRVNLGITLNAAALLLALLVLDLPEIGNVIYETTISPLTISLVVATFGIMLLSLLYKETKVIDVLSESLSKIVNNSKLIVSMLPAVIGLLPVGGGALMSAPLVEAETEKLGLKEDKKTYVNLWFRHTIFPVYPVSQFLILAAMLTGLTVTSLILRQIPVVISMVIIGYLIGFWKSTKTKEAGNVKANRGSELKRFGITFSPILATIIAVIIFSIDVSIAAFIGVAVLLAIAKPNLKTFIKPFKNRTLWGITLAAYGAFLLRNMAEAIGISQIFGSFVTNGNIDVLLLLTVIPAFLGAITGSPSGGIAISVSILTGIVSFTPKSASLLYISSYLGYVVAPTHLCLVLTAEYFKCSLGKLYKYLIPSLIVSFATGILVYLLV